MLSDSISCMQVPSFTILPLCLWQKVKSTGSAKAQIKSGFLLLLFLLPQQAPLLFLLSIHLSLLKKHETTTNLVHMESDIGRLLASNIWTMFYIVPYLCQAWYLLFCVCWMSKIRLIASRVFYKLHSMKIFWYFESLWLPPCKKKSYKYLELKLIEEKQILFSPINTDGFLFESVSAFLHAPRPNISSFKGITYIQPSH